MRHGLRLGLLVLLGGCPGEPEYPFCSELFVGELGSKDIKPEVLFEDGEVTFEFGVPVHGLWLSGGPRGRALMSRSCETGERRMPCIEPPVTFPAPERLIPGEEYTVETELRCIRSGRWDEAFQKRTTFVVPEPEQPAAAQ